MVIWHHQWGTNDVQAWLGLPRPAWGLKAEPAQHYVEPFHPFHFVMISIQASQAHFLALWVLAVMNDPPLFPFPSIPLLRYPTLNPCRTFTSTSMLSPSSPTSSDLLYDSFYESFLFLAYDSFGLIAWVTPIFRYDSLWLILRVILVFRPSDFWWLILWVISILSSWLIQTMTHL